MTDDRSAESHRAPFLRAMHEEASHFSAAVRSGDGAYTDLPEALLTQLAVAAFAAAATTATRISREHGSEDALVRSCAEVATAIEESVPPDLDALWKLHFVDGHSIAEYAARTGRDIAAARADYRNLLRALVAEPSETSAVNEIGAAAGVTILHAARP